MITNNYFIIADIGGTNANFEVVELIQKKIGVEKKVKVLWKENYKTAEVENFIEFINSLISKFISEKKFLIENAVFAVAGLIKNDEVNFSNHKLKINSKELIKNTALKKVELINDFYALAHSTFNIKKTHLEVIRTVKNKTKTKRKLVVGPGTGLGVAFITKKGEVVETEGGHVRFPVKNKEELKLVEFIVKKTGFENVSFEDILSGRGIENIYEFLSKTHKEFKEFPKKLSAEEISKNRYKNKVAKETFIYFYKFLARFLKNLSLIFLTDEIFLAGGVIQKNMKFSRKNFLNEFMKNPRFKEYLKSISIFIIKDYDESLNGIKIYIEREY